MFFRFTTAANLNPLLTDEEFNTLQGLTTALEFEFKWSIVHALEGLAALAANQSDFERALHLAGAAAVVRAQSGLALSAEAQVDLDQFLEPAQAALGAEAAATLFKEGGALELEKSRQS